MLKLLNINTHLAQNHSEKNGFIGLKQMGTRFIIQLVYPFHL